MNVNLYFLLSVGPPRPCFIRHYRVCIRIFRLEAARNHAAYGLVAHRETRGGSYDYKTSHFEKIITHQENTIPS